MVIPDINSELFHAFNEVTYYDVPHKYYYNDQQLVSVTTLIHEYENPFNEEYWSKIKADEYGLKQDDVKFIWRFINETATTLGSIVHDYAENLFLNKVFFYPENDVINKFGYDPIYENYLKSKAHVDKFYNDTFNKLIPIKTELVIFDKEALIGGMIDKLFWNVKAKCFQIWDYKSNSSDKAFSERDERLLGILSTLTNTDLNKYSLQTSIYKYIIEKYTNIKLGDSYLVWISHKNENYEIIKCDDLTFYAEMLVERRINRL